MSKMTNLFDFGANATPSEISRLIAAGADVNVKNDRGFTPFMKAACLGFEECAKLLVEHGADVNAQSNDGSTALIYAVHSGIVSSVQFILEFSPDLTIIDNEGDTAIDCLQKNAFIDDGSKYRIATLLFRAGQELKAKQINHGGAIYRAYLDWLQSEKSLLILAA